MTNIFKFVLKALFVVAILVFILLEYLANPIEVGEGYVLVDTPDQYGATYFISDGETLSDFLILDYKRGGDGIFGIAVLFEIVFFECEGGIEGFYLNYKNDPEWFSFSTEKGRRGFKTLDELNQFLLSFNDVYDKDAKEYKSFLNMKQTRGCGNLPLN